MAIIPKLNTKLLKSIALITILPLSSALYAQTIEEVLKLTIKSSPEILQKTATKNKQEYYLKGSMSGYLPQIDASGSYGSDTSKNKTTNQTSKTLARREGSLALNQMLFDGFYVKSDVEATAARLKGTANDVYNTVENVVLRSIEAYLEVLRLRTNIKFAKDNLATLQSIHQQIQLRTESGIAKKADFEQATARLALARTILMEQQANLRDAESTFRRITGFPADVLIRPELEENVLPATEDAAVAMALQNHPQLQKAHSDILAAQSDKKKAKASYYPTLNLQVTGTDNKNVGGDPVPAKSLSVMLKLNYNLFRGGKDVSQDHAASWALEETKEALNQTRRQVEQSMRISWNAYTNARAQLQYRKEHSEAIQKTRDAYRDQFNIGQRTLLDLLDSENELYAANTAYVSAQYIELLGKYRVLGSMGKLMHYFKIPVPEAAKYKPHGWIEGF